MAPFELFGRNFCLATLQHWLCVALVVLLRTENTCWPGLYGRESSLQGGQQAGLLAVPARPALNRGGGLRVRTHSGQYTLYSWCDRVKMAQLCVDLQLILIVYRLLVRF